MFRLLSCLLSALLHSVAHFLHKLSRISRIFLKISISLVIIHTLTFTKCLFERLLSCFDTLLSFILQFSCRIELIIVIFELLLPLFTLFAKIVCSILESIIKTLFISLIIWFLTLTLLLWPFFLLASVFSRSSSYLIIVLPFLRIFQNLIRVCNILKFR